MSRLLGVVIVAALCMGCRSSAPVYDPFMGRTTVPPPGTAVVQPGQPYYAAPPAGATTGPPLISPPPGASATPPAVNNGLASSFTPNVSPIPTSSTPASDSDSCFSDGACRDACGAGRATAQCTARDRSTDVWSAGRWNGVPRVQPRRQPARRQWHKLPPRQAEFRRWRILQLLQARSLPVGNRPMVRSQRIPERRWFSIRRRIRIRSGLSNRRRGLSRLLMRSR